MKDGMYFEEILLSLMEDFDGFEKSTREQDRKEGWDCKILETRVDVTLNFWHKPDVDLLYQEFMDGYNFNVGYKIRRGLFILVIGFDFPTKDVEVAVDILWDKWQDEIYFLIDSAVKYSESSKVM